MPIDTALEQLNPTVRDADIQNFFEELIKCSMDGGYLIEEPLHFVLMYTGNIFDHNKQINPNELENKLYKLLEPISRTDFDHPVVNVRKLPSEQSESWKTLDNLAPVASRIGDVYQLTIVAYIKKEYENELNKHLGIDGKTLINGYHFSQD